jgi:hypothetical protein
MAGDDYEPNRVLGFPRRAAPHHGPHDGPGGGPHHGPGDGRGRGPGEEPQRVMGFPVDWFGTADRDWLEVLAHPVRSCQRWLRHRQGPR